jgi:hypothetical protein
MIKRLILALAVVCTTGVNLRAAQDSAVAESTIAAPLAEAASGPAPPKTLEDHLAEKNDIMNRQIQNEQSYASTKVALHVEKNDVVAKIQNAKRERLEKKIEESTADAEKLKEKGEADAASADGENEEKQPSEAEQKAKAAAKESAKAACEGKKNKEKAEPSAEEKAAAEEAAATAKKKSEEELKAAKEQVKTMETSAQKSVEETHEKLQLHAETLEQAKSVKGGCKQNTKKQNQ